jgi:hypothetical protein
MLKYSACRYQSSTSACVSGKRATSAMRIAASPATGSAMSQGPRSRLATVEAMRAMCRRGIAHHASAATIV